MDDKVALEILEIVRKIEKRLEILEEGITFIDRNATSDMDDPDPLLLKALDVVVQQHKASASLIQRYLQIGYARSARILDQLARAGVISQANGAKPRKIYLDKAKALLSKQSK